MRDRTFVDFMVGALACMSVLGLCAMLEESKFSRDERRVDAECKWVLPRKRRRSQTPENDCRHCTGTGICGECAPVDCRVCKGTGVAPRDAALVSRLGALWDGAA